MYKQAIVESDKLPYTHAVNYVNYVRSHITAGTFSSYYAPYSKRYAEWKDKYFGNRGFWILKGHLLASLTAFRHQNGWMGGIPAGLMVEGSSWYGDGSTGQPRSIAEYGSWMEYGREGQPARPLFVPTMLDYANPAAKTEGLLALNRIGRKWG